MKIVGIVIIAISGLGVCFSLVRWAEERVRRVRALLELVLYVKNSVENYSMSVTEILAECDASLIERAGYRAEAGPPESLLAMAEGLDISDERSRTAFFEMAASFGKSYRLEQTKQCEICVDILRERASALERRLPALKKNVISVCVSVTLMIVILLL